MSKVSKTITVYGLAALLIIASWIGNYAYNRYYQLPEGRFLTHHIETTDTPSVAFDLLYIANKNDKRTIQTIAVKELPTLRFYPVQVHQELNRQTIYNFMGSYVSDPARIKALPPLVIHDVDVTFDDGRKQTMNVGEIIVYRNAYPPRLGVSALSGISTSGSNDNTGSDTMRAERDVELMSTTSGLLAELGSAFQFNVNVIGEPDGFGIPRIEAVYPVKLTKGQNIVTDYVFRFPAQDPHALDVFDVLLTHKLHEANGRETLSYMFDNYKPYFTEAQMKAFVRAQRREAE